MLWLIFGYFIAKPAVADALELNRNNGQHSY